MIGILEREPLQFTLEPKHLLLGLDGSLRGWGFRCQPAPQPEGELFEVGVGLGRGAEHLQAFVFAHRIHFRGGELPQPYHPSRGIPPPDPRRLKNPRQEPLQGVFSALMDPDYLEKSRCGEGDSVSDQRQT